MAEIASSKHKTYDNLAFVFFQSVTHVFDSFLELIHLLTHLDYC